MKILMLSSTFPYPPTRGGTQVRTFNLLKYLSQNHKITLVTQRVRDITEVEIEQLREYVEELVVFPPPTDIQEGIVSKIKRFGQFWLEGTPPNVSYIYSANIQKWVDEAVGTGRFEALTCEHSVNEIYVRPQWKKQLRTVVNIHSSVYQTCKNQLETGTSQNQLRDRLYLPLLLRYERGFLSKFNSVVVTTPEDKQQILGFNPNLPVSVISNGVDLQAFPDRQADPGGHSIIITGGMDYVVNIDAACFFAVEVLPILQQKYPDTTLTVVGSKPAPEVLELAKRPGIAVTGRVPSMAEYLHQATVCVVPMRAGFGIKNKTLEAMATGVPVVGSDRGLEGIEADSTNVPLRALRANRVEEYVEAIARLFEDPQLREQLSTNARSLIEQQYTWESAGRSYEEAIFGSC